MKKMILGIAVLLFAILFRLCSTGLENAALVIGIVGLIIVITGILDKSE